MDTAPRVDEWAVPDLPTVQQLEELTDVLRDTLRQRGKGISTRVTYDERGGRILARGAGQERLITGEVIDWSVPDREGRTEIRRLRRFSALRRTIGAGAARLIVAESDAVRVQRPTGDIYQYLRTTYAFGWNALSGVYEAKKNPIEIISPVAVDAEVLPRLEFDAPDRLMFSVERTSPPERFDFGWQSAGESDVDGLLRRAHEYQRDALELLEDK